MKHFGKEVLNGKNTNLKIMIELLFSRIGVLDSSWKRLKTQGQAGVIMQNLYVELGVLKCTSKVQGH